MFNKQTQGQELLMVCSSENELSSGPALCCRLQTKYQIQLFKQIYRNPKCKVKTSGLFRDHQHHLKQDALISCRDGISVMQVEFQISTGAGLTEPMNHRENANLLPEVALQTGPHWDESGSGQRNGKITRTQLLRISSVTPMVDLAAHRGVVLLWVQRHHPTHTEPQKVPNISLSCSVQI